MQGHGEVDSLPFLVHDPRESQGAAFPAALNARRCPAGGTASRAAAGNPA